MKSRDTLDLSRLVNERNARLTRRADAAADFVVAIVVGICLALALVHFMLPCATGELC
jgi:hypothetical protein